VCETRRLPANHAQPRTAIATRDQLLDATVVETRRRAAAILDEDLGEIAAATKRVTQCLLQQSGVDHLAYRKPVPLMPGLTASVTLVVEDRDTAPAIGSGDVPVLATPRIVALAEQATIEAVAGELEPGSTTVGYEVQLTHLAPTPVGGKVTAEATLEGLERRRLSFRVSVNDARGLVAAGRITRVVVERERFIERARGEH
jgi:predicted thioesterase